MGPSSSSMYIGQIQVALVALVALEDEVRRCEMENGRLTVTRGRDCNEREG